jgi:hypothetical protein
MMAGKDKPGQLTGAGGEVLLDTAKGPEGEALPPVEGDEEREAEGFDAEGQHTTALDRMAGIVDDLELSTGELVFDVRDFLLDTIKQRPKPWSSTSQAEQRDVAAACEHSATELIRKIVEAVAARGVVPVRVLLTKVTLGDDIVIAGKVKTYSDDEADKAVMILHKAHGKHVMLTVASVEDYRGEGRDAETDVDEPPLDFEAQDDEGFEPGE